jgi:AraC family transcriptional regulator
MLAMKQSSVARGLADVTAHIRRHLNEPLDLNDLADRAGFSRYHFHRVFRAVVGEPLAAYVRRERLQQSALALRRTNQSITALALEAGYDTPSAFTRAFTEHFGVTPSEFRRDDSTPVVPQHALPRFRGEPMAVRVITLPARRLLALRHVGSYRNVGDAFARLLAIAAPRNLVTDATEFLGLSYDDPDAIAESALRFDACMTAGGEVVPEPLRWLEHAGGKHAVYRHCGPYQLLEHVFDRMFDLVVFSGEYELRDAPCVEIYRNDPKAVKTEDLITDVCIPIL